MSSSSGSVPPPPPFAPPPIIAPPSAPKPRRSWGWIITSIVLAFLLLLCVLVIGAQFSLRGLSFNNGLRTSTARDVGPKLDECLIEDNNSRNKIAVITVDGIITSHGGGQGSDMVEVLKAQLDRAAEDDRVKAVILKVDSPGGEVMASDQINKALQDFQADDIDERGKVGHKGKPVICSMGSLAASGGYYISAPCRWIVADELTLTGSIGVIMHGINYRGLMDKVGVMPMTFKSGKFKDMLSPDREPGEIPPEEREMMQALIDETYQKFKGVVEDGRTAAFELNKKASKEEDKGKALADDWADYADGRVVSGTQAYNIGLVDELGDFDDAVNRTLEITHLKDANLIEYQERYDFASFLSMFGQNGQAKDIKLDLGVEVPKLRPGCLYFLAPNFGY